jgi:hypothetical protein
MTVSAVVPTVPQRTFLLKYIHTKLNGMFPAYAKYKIKCFMLFVHTNIKFGYLIFLNVTVSILLLTLQRSHADSENIHSGTQLRTS